MGQLGATSILMPQPTANKPPSAFCRSPEWYDRAINWSKRLKREVPVLAEVLGPPGKGGVIDAGCGPGRQACALAERGYRVVGIDNSAEMIELARRRAQDITDCRFEAVPFAEMAATLGGGFDGVYCIGNSLAAAETAEAGREAVAQFGKCLRPGGVLLAQVLNFPPMREQLPCVRGPSSVTVDGVEYVRCRHYHFLTDTVQVTSVTMWQENGWQMHAGGGMLYPLTPEELDAWCRAARLEIETRWADYAGTPFDPVEPTDLIIKARRV